MPFTVLCQGCVSILHTYFLYWRILSQGRYSDVSPKVIVSLWRRECSLCVSFSGYWLVEQTRKVTAILRFVQPANQTSVFSMVWPMAIREEGFCWNCGMYKTHLKTSTDPLEQYLMYVGIVAQAILASN